MIATQPFMTSQCNLLLQTLQLDSFVLSVPCERQLRKPLRCRKDWWKTFSVSCMSSREQLSVSLRGWFFFRSRLVECNQTVFESTTHKQICALWRNDVYLDQRRLLRRLCVYFGPHLILFLSPTSPEEMISIRHLFWASNLPACYTTALSWTVFS